MSTTAFSYQALSSNHIRVLELQPAQKGETLVCKLRTQGLQEIPYEAISYVWGKPTKDVTILCDGQILSITTNLSEALAAFRLKGEPRRLWADGICINQDDDTEREAQVRLMGQIYSTAERVLGWLGPDDGNGRLIKDIIYRFNYRPDESIQYVQEALRLPQTPDGNFVAEWNAIKDFFDRPFFHRVWIIQELGLGKQAMLWFGSHSIDWSEISRFVFILDNKAAFLVNHFRLRSWIVNHTYLIWQHFNGRPRYSFEEILHWARVHQSTDQRDRIFAMLGHPSATVDGSLVVQPNYASSYTHLDAYVDTAKAIITRNKALRILCFVDHDEQPDSSSSGLPTWAPAWHIENKVMFLSYPSCAGPVTDPWIDISQSGDMSVLRVRGFVVDTISALSNIMDAPGFLVTTREDELRKSIPFLLDHLWGVLSKTSTDSAAKEQCLESIGLALACEWVDGKHAVQNRAKHGADFAAYILEYENILEEATSSKLLASFPPEFKQEIQVRSIGGSAVQFVQSMQSCNARRIFRTTEGRYGLGPRIARPGDSCCVLAGSQFPMIMRKAQDKWQVVGQTILQGYMDFEAFTLFRQSKLPLHVFSII